ncbi:NAD(P)-dependent alcohol dehydrogenase [Neolewinella antarctica]|uniref:Zinc-type alcohol dehydrogenase-like protein n=1 Tax=Neolewinella antarctica TaxID=442734 RepID=A0ABX0XDU0_9BACT|nr:NAD(P)-dependent alcohol dehydrogenase [Neolewinella antarctica]NJC27073.1 putative zinc-type alcohol dehydrogenase-like protein [Neolewinella antarctica]
MKVHGYGATAAKKDLVPVTFERPDPQAGEIGFKVTHCGVCHSDVHQVNDDWGNTVFPSVPGHEIIGRVTSVGAGVTKFKVGDHIGVGCMVNSCQTCEHCQSDEEQYCIGPKGATLTYNGPTKPDGTNTYGGYTTHMVVREEFAITIPAGLEPEYGGPIMCAGVTTYSPMKHWNLQKGQTLGVAGIGGLGHMAVQLGRALGAKVIAFTGHESKRADILKLGADEVVVTSDEDAMTEHAMSVDLMINTIPYPFDPAPFISVMKKNSTIVIVGNFISIPEFVPADLVFNRIQIAGSLIGGVKDTQEVVDLCAKHGIRPQIKMIKMEEINEVMATLKENSADHEFRHVIDMESMHAQVDGGKAKAESIEQPVRGEVVGA